MDKLKPIVEMVGKRIPITESLPRIDGVYLKGGMKIRLKAYSELLKNHFYENHPEKYKKMFKEIADTTREIETVAQNKLSNVETNNIKLVGYDLWIETDDVLRVVDFAGKVIIPKQHMEKLKMAVEDAIFKELSFRTTIDSRNFSRKELGNVIRDIANMIGKEGKPPKVQY